MEHLLSNISQKVKSIEEHLDAATESIPKSLLDESGLKDEIRKCKENMYNHFWMENLHNIGKWIEEIGKDEELPESFWEHLIISAMLMEFFEFIPYMEGKMKRKSKKNWYDVIAAVVLMNQYSDEKWLDDKSELKERMEDYVQFLTTLNKNYPSLLNEKKLNLNQLSDNFAKNKILEGGIDEEKFAKTNRMFMELFYQLFSAINEERLLTELEEAAWAIINVNTFKVKLSDGMFPSTYAAVFWDN